MKKLLLFAVFTMMVLVAYSQKIVRDETDKFTGHHVKETSYVAISDGFNCALRTVNDAHVLLAGFNCNNKASVMVEGAEFMLKLQNDSIITLQNMEDAVAEYWSTTVGSLHLSHFNLKTKYILSDEQLKQLQTTPITVVRFYTTEGYIERNVSQKNSKKLQKLFNLMNLK